MRREGWIIEQKLVLYAAAMRQARSLNISVGKPSLVVKRVSMPGFVEAETTGRLKGTDYAAQQAEAVSVTGSASGSQQSGPQHALACATRASFSTLSP
jgi:hypothetical protein